MFKSTTLKSEKRTKSSIATINQKTHISGQNSGQIYTRKSLFEKGSLGESKSGGT